MKPEKENEILKLALSKQSTRIASLALDLDLAHSQIDILTKEVNELKKPIEKAPTEATSTQ